MQSVFVLQVLCINGQLALSDATHRDGLLCGSNTIDDLLERYVADLMGKEQTEATYRQCPGMLHQMRYDDACWQDAKKAFDGTGPATVILPAEVVNHLPAEVRCNSNDWEQS